jgi:hypothetical protein
MQLERGKGYSCARGFRTFDSKCSAAKIVTTPLGAHPRLDAHSLHGLLLGVLLQFPFLEVVVHNGQGEIHDGKCTWSQKVRISRNTYAKQPV